LSLVLGTDYFSQEIASGTLNFWFGTRQNFILQGPLKKKKDL